MQECVFCRIVAGEIPAARLIETDLVISFMDIAPVNHGHCLVVPRRHAATLLELTEEELHDCVLTAQRLARAVMKATGSPGLNLLQNNDRCAGQLVGHAHFHVIPRSPDDGFSFGWRQDSYAEGELERMACAINKNLR